MLKKRILKSKNKNKMCINKRHKKKGDHYRTKGRENEEFSIWVEIQE